MTEELIPVVLWVDDDMRVMTGLRSYLDQLAIRLHRAEAYDEGRDRLEKHVDLVLLDVVLMRARGEFSLERRLGARLAREALDRGVSNVILYTVLDGGDVNRIQQELELHADSRGLDVRVAVFRPQDSPRVIVEKVRDMLKLDRSENGEQ